jgi:hypothetical protein
MQQRETIGSLVKYKIYKIIYNMTVETEAETSVVLVLALDEPPCQSIDADKEDLDKDDSNVTVAEEEEEEQEAQEKAPCRWGKKPRSNRNSRNPTGNGCCKEPSLLSRVDWAYALLCCHSCTSLWQ